MTVEKPKVLMPDFMFDPAGVDVMLSPYVRRPMLLLPKAEYDALKASLEKKPAEPKA